jgi:excinuclease ABC subunit C
MLHSPSQYPATPGIYMMKDERNRIIYVGKARNIRKRVASYFRQDSALSPKTRVMMAKVRKIESISTLNEKEALLLEASLIKKHRPRYNIVLRDDKQYVLFRLDKSRDYPTFELTRKAKKDNCVYFGPFTSGMAARQTLRVINKLFLLRKCGHKKFRNRVRPCLQYFIKRCLAPCCLAIDKDEYNSQVRQVELFLAGKSKELLARLEAEMLMASKGLEYEKAAIIRDQIRAVRETTRTQSVDIPAGQDMDVFNLSHGENGLCVGVIFVRQGKVLDNKNFFWPDQDVSEPDEARRALISILSQFYGPDRFIPGRIVLPMSVQDPALTELLSHYRGGRVRIIRGRGRIMNSLLDMAGQNSLNYASRTARSSKLNLAGPLNLNKEPCRVECVDVSHHAGQDTRLGSVVFERALPVKSDYRLYSLPDVPPGDDYQAMRRFIARRKNSEVPMPDLLLVDGGPGQLNTVQKALEDSAMTGLFDVAAISKGPTRSKGELHDRVFIPGRKNPVSLKPGSPEMLFLQKVRDEAHRFVISSLRKAAGKGMRTGNLESVPGIGPKRAKALWEHFKDLEAIMSADAEELARTPGLGPAAAKKIAGNLKEWNTSNT